MKRKGIGKKITAWLLSIAMVVTTFNLPSNVTLSHAEENDSVIETTTEEEFSTTDAEDEELFQEPAYGEAAITEKGAAFASLEDLKNPNKYTLHTDNGTGIAQKVHFGEGKTWYIAGAQDGGLVLLMNPKCTGQGMFTDENGSKNYEKYMGTYIDKDPQTVPSNHYGGGPVRQNLKELEETFTSSEQLLMLVNRVYTQDMYTSGYPSRVYNNGIYYNEDKLYLAYGTDNQQYILVGANNEADLGSGIKVGLSTSNGVANSPYVKVSAFWLRTPPIDEESVFGLCAYSTSVSHIAGNNPTIKILPTMHLNAESLSFAASASPAPESEVAEDNSFYFRFAAGDKIDSTVTACTGGVKVEKGSDAADVYLLVQSTDSDDTWVYSKKITASGLITVEQIQADAGLSDIELGKCKVWLEYTVDNVTYAKEAVYKDVHEYHSLGDEQHECLNCGMVENHTDTELTYVNTTMGKHYTICVCGYQSEEAAHTFSNYVSNNNPSCIEKGTKTAKCDYCDATETVIDEDSEPLGHETAVLRRNSVQHYYACPRCGEVEGDIGIHNLNNGSSCSVCKYYGMDTTMVVTFASNVMLRNSNVINLQHKDWARMVEFGTIPATEDSEATAQSWYIAGVQGNDLVLICSPLTPFSRQYFVSGADTKRTYDESMGTYEDTAPTSVSRGHYGASDLRKYLNAEVSNRFTPAEQNLMANPDIYTDGCKTNDKLYIPYGSGTTIHVGSNGADAPAEIDIPTSKDDAIPAFNVKEHGKEFWLRGSQSTYHHMDRSTGWVTTDNRLSMDLQYDVVPVCHISMDKLLFASRAALLSDGTASVTGKYKLRFDGTGKVGSTAKYDANGVKVTKGGENEYLYIVYESAPFNSVYIREITSDMTIYKDCVGVADFNDCRIWIDKYNPTDNLIYAMMATYAPTGITGHTIPDDANVCLWCNTCKAVAESGKHHFVNNVELGKHVCTVCGRSGSHTYNIHVFKDNNDATCTEPGTKQKKCDNCENLYILPTLPLGHDFWPYVPDGNATCTEPGTKTAICSHEGCNETDTKEGTPLVHEYVNGICPNCGEYEVPGYLSGFDSRYYLRNEGNLLWYAEQYNSGAITDSAELRNDITLTTKRNVIIGTKEHPFKSKFSGGKYTIRGLEITEPLIYDANYKNAYAGLFGYVAGTNSSNCAEISQLNVEGTINISCDDTVDRKYFGGVVGSAYRFVKIRTVTSNVNITVTGGKDSHVGGVVGSVGLDGSVSNNGYISISRSRFIGSIDVDNASYCGGIIAYIANESSIDNCLNAGSIHSDTTTVGGIKGLVGYIHKHATVNNFKISKCLNLGEVTGGQYPGALVGYRICTDETFSDLYYVSGDAYTNYDGISELNIDPSKITQCTMEQIASGEIAYLLNDGKSGSSSYWFQKLGADGDSYPTFLYTYKPNTWDINNAVYKFVNCDGKVSYTNDSSKEVDNTGNHVFTIKVDDEYHKCKNCEETQAHTLGEYLDDGSGKHYQICAVCQKATTHKAHTFDGEDAITAEKHTCDKCGLSMNHAFTVKVDDTNHECEFCGYTEEHTLGEWLEDEDGQHYKTCSVCEQDITHEKHTYNGEEAVNADNHMCDVCSIAGAHDYTNRPFIDAENGKHYQTCGLCEGKSAEAYHTYTVDKAEICPDCGAANVNTGKCSENVSYAVIRNGTSTYTLVIFGEGDTEAGNWTEEIGIAKDKITQIVVEPGITSIGKEFFVKFTKVDLVKLPVGLTRISERAFYGRSDFNTIIFIPDSVTLVEDYALGATSKVLPVFIGNPQFEDVHKIYGYIHYASNRIERGSDPTDMVGVGVQNGKHKIRCYSYQSRTGHGDDNGYMFETEDHIYVNGVCKSSSCGAKCEHTNRNEHFCLDCGMCLAVIEGGEHVIDNTVYYHKDGAGNHYVSCATCLAPIQKENHSYTIEDTQAEGTLVSAATCTDKASYRKICACGAVSTSDADIYEYGEPLGHKYTVKVDAKKHQCSRCDSTEDHNFSEQGNAETCSACLAKNINAASLDSKVVSEDTEYTGSELTSAVSITGLVKDEDYTLTDLTKTEVGTYTITVTGEGDYAGVREVNWNIVAGKPVLQAPKLTATFGDILLNVSLTGKNPASNVAGTWTWKDASASVGEVGTHTFKANFAPTDTTHWYGVEDVDVEVTVGKAVYSGAEEYSKSYLYSKEYEESINLTQFVPEGAGEVSFEVEKSATGTDTVGTVSVEGTDLQFVVNKMEAFAENTATAISITVKSANYKDFVQVIKVTRTDCVHPAEMIVTEHSTPATCEEKGVDLRRCNQCGEVVESGIVTNALGHNYVNGKCTRCEVVSLKLSGDINITVEKVRYDGNNHKPAVTVSYKGTELVANVDYTIAVDSRKAIGSYELVITGVNKFRDSVTASWSISPNNGLWCAEIPDQTYTGKAIKPVVEVYDDGKLLVAGKDYTITYGKNNTNVASKNAVNAKGVSVAPSITIVGKGNYGQKETVYFNIVPYDFAEEEISAKVDDIAIAKPKKAVKVAPVVTLNGKKLKAGKDYVVSTTTDAKDVVGTLLDVEDYDLYVVGIGNYAGAIPFKFIISEAILASKVAITKIPDQNYDEGRDIEPAVEILYNKENVTDQFEVTYDNNSEIGTATAIVTAKDGSKFAGSKKATFKILGEQIKNAKLGADGKGIIPAGTYSGDAYEPELDLYVGSEKLIAGKDYTVKYEKQVNVGTATAVVTGVGKYTGSKKFTYKINPYNAETDIDKVITINGGSAIEVAYEKSGTMPKPVIEMNGMILVEKKDYTLGFANNKDVADQNAAKAPTVTITFKGNFTGKKPVTFTITKKDIGECTMVAADKPVSTKANAWKQTSIAIVDTNGKKLAAKKDYDAAVKYYAEEECLNEITAETLEAGTVVYVKAVGLQNYEGTEIVGSYRISKLALKSAKVVIADQTYTGEEICPEAKDIQVTIGKNTPALTADADYEIIEGSFKNNINKGKASVTIRGIGDYYGTKVVTFKIKEKGLTWWQKLLGL